MKLLELKNQFFTQLQEVYSLSELEFLFPIFMEDLFTFPKETIRSNLQQEFLSDIKNFEKSIEDLKRGVPYQYVLGSTEFYGLKLKLNSSTLIPRPETEEMLDHIAKSNIKGVNTAADFGCGSGCIAIGLKKIFNNAKVCGFDISREALTIATENSMKNKLEVDFSKWDILSSSTRPLNKSFDLIVSNPPYVRELEKENMDSKVLEFEPHGALFVPNADALKFYEALEKIGQKHLNLSGIMFFEINQYLGKETEEIYKSKNWQVELFKDMSGNDRFLKVWK